jgi:HTH-type transcriptional regulator/antitoxin HipB
MTQRDLALVAGTGERFVVDLEAGKTTTQLGLALAVAAAVGLIVSLDDPHAADAEPSA